MADQIRPEEKISDAYARLTATEAPALEAEMRDFIDSLRRQMVGALLEEGYERQDIQNVLEAEDAGFRQMTSEQQNELLDSEIPADHIGKETGSSAVNVVRRVRDQNALQIFDYTRPHDLSVVCDLLDSGYPVPDVVATSKKNSFATKFFHEGSSNLNTYFDSVWNDVNRTRMLRAGRRMEACRNAYIEKATSSMIQYKDQTKEKDGFSLFQDGRVVISLLVLHRFDPKVVEAVVAECSFNPKRSPEYAKELVAQALKVKEAYDAIERVQKTSDAKSVGDVYRYYSYQFMEKRGKKLLTPEDEQFVLRTMAGNHIDNNNIESSYREASPVALEPGRNKDKYLDNSLYRFHLKYESQKAWSMEQYPKTKETYLEKAKQLEEALASRNYDINKNRSYYDCLLATSMIRMQHSSYNLRKAIAELSPLANKPNENNPSKTPDGYASWIVSKARDVVMREQDIMFSPKIEGKRDLPLTVLTAGGVTVADLYKDSVRRIVEGYAKSGRDRMIEPHVDQQACEELLTKYPDIILDDLADALKKASPRAAVAGMIQDYPQKCVETVQQRLQEADQARSFRRSVEAEFNRSRGLEMGGISEYGGMAIFAQSMGHAAMEMQRQGVNEVALRETLLHAASDIPEKTQFVDRVLQSVREVTRRQEDIAGFSRSIGPDANIEEKYLAYANSIQKEVGAYQTSDDIEFVKLQMMQNEQLDIDEMNNMLLAKSPVAAEPGRDEHYVEYLQDRAKERIELENEKLRIYHPEPRIEGKEKDCYKEYEYHRNTLMRNVSMPYDERMDMYIAETLLLQGYPEREVENVLGKSPLAEKNKGHALKVVNMVRDRLDDDIDYQMIIDKGNGKEQLVQDHVRVRTIETTTTTSSGDD